MKSSAIHRLPWLLSLLAACADDAPAAPGDGGTTGATGGSTLAPESTDDGQISATFVADDTADDTADGTADDTVGTTASTEGTDDSGSGSTAANIEPVAEDDTYYVDQNGTLNEPADGVLANDSDEDGDALVVAEADAMSAGGGSVSVEPDGALTYSPATDYFGRDTFSYTIEDPAGATATATVTVFVAPSAIHLGDVDAGIGGYVITGDTGQAGFSVGGAGDVSGDGLDDVVIGAPFATGGGRAYVVFGKADTEAIALQSIGGQGFVMQGFSGAQSAGFSVSGAGDFNGDAVPDVIVGAPTANSVGANGGRAYVVFGKSDSDPVNFTVLGDGGFMIEPEAVGDFLGYSVSGAGDVNGDGFADVLVGAVSADPNGADSGRGYIVFGHADPVNVDLAALGTGGFALNGEATTDSAGRAVAAVGDVNGDTFDDVVIGAPYADPAGAQSGRAYLVLGKDADTDPVELGALGDAGFVMDGSAAGDNSGLSLAGAGDVNGDGVPDFIVGNGSAGIGEEYGGCQVIFGKADTDPIDLGAVGTNGFAINGEFVEDNLCFGVGGAGDVNGDGLADLIVGAPLADTNNIDAGRSYVVFGKADSASVNLNALGDGGYVVDGQGVGDESGFAVGGAGDVNADGFADIIIGARYGQGNAVEAGRVYIVFGVPTAPKDE